MNSDDLEELKWEYREKPLSVITIFAWAQVWNTVQYPEIPLFEMIDQSTLMNQADIRVKFSSKFTFLNHYTVTLD